MLVAHCPFTGVPTNEKVPVHVSREQMTTISGKAETPWQLAIVHWPRSLEVMALEIWKSTLSYKVVFLQFLQPGWRIVRIVDDLANHSMPKILVAFARIVEFWDSPWLRIYNDFGFDYQ